MMRKLGACVLGLALLALTAGAAAQGDKGGKELGGGSIKVEVKGTLKTGIMAIGGETTGTIITTPQGTLELDFGTNKELKEQAGKLNGKEAVAKGTLQVRKGVAVKQRLIVGVTELKAAEGK
jgi:hypothetical protein